MRLGYQEAFNKIYKQYQDKIFDNPFFFYSVILDYVSCSIIDKKLAKIYFLLENRLKFHLLLTKTKQKDLLNILKEDYNDYNYNCSFEELLESVKPLVIFDKKASDLNCSKKIAKKECVKESVVIEEGARKISLAPSIPKQEYFSKIYVYANCAEFIVSLYHEQEARLYKADKKTGVLTEVDVDIKDNRLTVWVFDYSSTYLLYLPEREYELVTLRSSTASFRVGSYFSKDFLKAKRLSIHSFHRSVEVAAVSNYLEIECDTDIQCYGTYNVLKLTSNKGDIKGIFKISKNSRKPSITALAKLGFIKVQIEGVKAPLMRFLNIPKRKVQTTMLVDSKKVTLLLEAKKDVIVL